MSNCKIIDTAEQISRVECSLIHGAQKSLQDIPTQLVQRLKAFGFANGVKKVEISSGYGYAFLHLRGYWPNGKDAGMDLCYEGSALDFNSYFTNEELQRDLYLCVNLRMANDWEGKELLEDMPREVKDRLRRFALGHRVRDVAFTFSNGIAYIVLRDHPRLGIDLGLCLSAEGDHDKFDRYFSNEELEMTLSRKIADLADQ